MNFVFSATPPRNVNDIRVKGTIKRNTYVIIIVLTLLVFLILITLIVFYVMYVRRRNFKKQGNSHYSIRDFAIKLLFFFLFCDTKSMPRRPFVILTFTQPISVDCSCCLVKFALDCLTLRATYSTHQH